MVNVLHLRERAWLVPMFNLGEEQTVVRFYLSPGQGFLKEKKERK